MNAITIVIFATIFHLFMRRYSRQIIAVFLLFLFLEKAGVRLWIHTHYHISRTAQTSSDNNKLPHSSVSAQCCDCIDDFFVPLTAADEILVSIPSICHPGLFLVHYKSLIPSSVHLSSKLRGPPFTA